MHEILRSGLKNLLNWIYSMSGNKRRVLSEFDALLKIQARPTILNILR